MDTRRAAVPSAPLDSLTADNLTDLPGLLTCHYRRTTPAAMCAVLVEALQMVGKAER